jgi:hypothetical protein
VKTHQQYLGAIVRSVTKLASITFLSLVLSPTGSINLGFTTEGRLAAVLNIPSLGVPNWPVIYINTAPSAPLPDVKEVVLDDFEQSEGTRQLLHRQARRHQ